MTDDPYVIGAAIVGAVNLVAGIVGAVQYSTGHVGGSGFWRITRTGQLLAALYAVFCGIYAVTVEGPQEGLTWVYILTPIAVSYFAEQLRLVAVQVVLERHGFDTPDELREAVARGSAGANPVADPKLVTGIAHAVVLREVAVMSTAAIVIAFLAWRAVIGQ